MANILFGRKEKSKGKKGLVFGYKNGLLFLWTIIIYLKTSKSFIRGMIQQWISLWLVENYLTLSLKFIFLLNMFWSPPLSSITPIICNGLNFIKSTKSIFNSSYFFVYYFMCFLYFYLNTSYIISLASLGFLPKALIGAGFVSSLKSMEPAKPYRFDFFSCFFNFSLKTLKQFSMNSFSWFAWSILAKRES